MSRARDFVNNAIGSAFGLGLSPVAPGSFGALLGVGYELAIEGLLPDGARFGWLLAGLVLVVATNHWLTPWAVRYWNDEDPGNFVLDEVAGYLMVPLLYRGVHLWETAILGFLLFRVLDIVKIPPARQIDRDLHGPWGIVLDDIISGAYAALVLYGLRWFGVLASP
jgi:phosphatidylglycerophosphatase A